MIMKVQSVEMQIEEGTPPAALSREGQIEMLLLEMSGVRRYNAATPHTECNDYGLLHVSPTSLTIMEATKWVCLLMLKRLSKASL
jgi:hypothetical protein